MAVNDIAEYPTNPDGSLNRDYNPFEGPVTAVSKLGFGWKANWFDGRDRQKRDLIIHIDTGKKTMNIVETGGGGNSPTQVWNGSYEASGDVYTMEGNLVQQNGAPPPKAFKIIVTDLTLPA